MYFGKCKINNTQPCFIVAELGTAHNGDLKKAFKLIDSAKQAQADCVKFQLILADEIIHPHAGQINLPTGKIDLYKKFKQLERNTTFYKKIKLCTSRGGTHLQHLAF